MNTRNEPQASLALHLMDVADCRVARSVLEQPLGRLSAEALKCAPLIGAQLLAGIGTAGNSQSGTRWQVPEPWNGHLATAPILFVGQNPSANLSERYPTLHELECPAARGELPEFFNGRFGPGEDAPIVGGTRVRQVDEQLGSPSRFLRHVLSLATKLLGRPAIPGEDYAITEAVRCKAAHATGVAQALETCARHLPTTLKLSGARVVICLGSLAHQAFESAASLPKQKPGKPFAWGERKAILLAHPNARGNAAHKAISNSVARELRSHLLKRRSAALI